MTAILLGALFLFLLCCSAFFSGSEVAFFSLRRWRIERYRLEARGAAPLVAALLRDPRGLLVTILVGNETVNVCLANVGSELRRQAEGLLASERALWTRLSAVLLTTLLLVLFGEITPKNIALAMPERWALLAARPLSLWGALVSRPRAALAALAGAVAGKAAEAPLTDEDFLNLLSEGERSGILNPRERELIQSVFEFRDTTVRAIMTPRADVSSLDVSATVDEAIAHAGRHQYSRIPVTEGDDIVGVAYVNDLVAHKYDLKPAASLRALMRAPLMVPEAKKAKELLREFQQRSVQMAVVINEYGATVGLVTMDDLLSEIVGEIADSFDTRVAYFTELQPGVYRVLARMPLDEFAARTGATIEAEGCYTVGGLALKLFGRLPRRGESVESDSFQITVLATSGRQLVTLLVRDRRGGRGKA